MMFSKTIGIGIAIIALVTGAMIPLSSKAASQDECAIWLCLPGGFPQGCGSAYSAYIRRIRNLQPPLPPFAACVVSGDTYQSSQGRYELGSDLWEECPTGTMSLDGYSYYQYVTARHCVDQQCLDANPQALNLLMQGFPAPGNCRITTTTRREKPNFIKMWVDHEYLGQFFY